MPEISVIVPVYKAEAYLHACIDSILSQTFSGFELILVDDGSPDNCGAICDDYAARDSRVRVIHQEIRDRPRQETAPLLLPKENGSASWTATTPCIRRCWSVCGRPPPGAARL